MSALRRLTVIGVVAAACGLSAPAAGACLIDSFGASGGSGGAVKPGDPVNYTIRVVTSDESPGDSRYVVDVAGRTVGSGFAAPSNSGGEWTYAGTFAMPDLGASKTTVVVQLRLIDTQGFKDAPALQYGGTPPAPASQPADTGTPPAAPDATPPTSAAAPTAAPAPRPRGPRVVARVGRQRVATRTPPLRNARRSRPHPRTSTPAVTVQPQLRQAAPAAIAAPSTAVPVVRAAKRTRPHAHRVVLRHRGIAPQALLTAPHDGARIASQPGSLRTFAPAGSRAWRDDVGLVLLLVLVVGGGGLAAVRVRRRSPERLAPTRAESLETLQERELAIEAELQQMLLDARAAGAAPEPRERAPA